MRGESDSVLYGFVLFHFIQSLASSTLLLSPPPWPILSGAPSGDTVV